MYKRTWHQAILIAATAVCGLAFVPWTALQNEPWRAFGAIQPRIAPDGSQVALSYQGAIWRISREGGVMKRLTSSAGWDAYPAWSPDGKRIAFLSDGVVKLIDAQTGAPMPLENRVEGRSSMQFSPDGKKLLGTFMPSEKNWALAWLDLETGGLTSVLDPPTQTNAFALSPDGQAIAYATHRDVDDEQSGNNGPQADLWILDSKARQPKKVLRFPSRIFNLTWNGASLIAVSDLGGAHNDLWEIPVANSLEGAHKLTFGQADEDTPSVAGTWLLYTDNRHGTTALVTRNLLSGTERTLEVTKFDFGRPAAVLELGFFDKETAGSLPARVALQQVGGKSFGPPGSLYRIHGGQMDFISAGSSRFEVPSGFYHLHAYHGPEYKTTELTIEVPSGKTTSVRVELERWANPQSRGFYSGESHIHANYGHGEWYNTPEEMKTFIQAEGLNVANFVVANSDSDGVFDREFFRGEPDPHSSARNVLYWNEEFRATLWGHMTLLNLKQLVEPIFTGFADTTNPWDTPTNADIADHVHLQGGHVNYTHPASNVKDPYLGEYSAKAMPVDVALGKIDSLDINSHGYEATVSLWYRLLNCGFRLPASAGTDCFLNRISGRGLPGADRAYVKIEGDFSYAGWIRGLKLGRSFVTNGPLLDFESGQQIQLDKPSRVPIQAKVTSPLPLDRFELVYNGEVVAFGQLGHDRLSGLLNEDVELDKSGWLSVRAFAGKLQAHASPIYIDIAGKPTASEVDAEYFLSWIDRLEKRLKQRNRIPGAHSKSGLNLNLVAHVEAQLNAAREVYRQIVVREK